ncbi:aspartate aminotransferase family protein [Agathobaculum sp. NTUH-O15-33]|uniref:aspartate aminotransferase family protein n=1 Tax=Agathobaculum sp. NTUH-O15-33 TaxID=3079302 RepID=UPI0029589153|nr:aspartate aminotransferase family protein [Agathobaculum sp. NTUH-O15-33]WNX86154.1 aspartate aminotransferase family protein [Agathobaculum sp. NTUH-O15-33]
MNYEQLKSEESQYVMNTYGRFPIALDRGEGATVWDVEGKRYIDLASGIGVNCMGYNNKKVIDAITEQAHKLMHVSNLFTTEPMVKVAKKLVTETGMGKVFFANSGAEANEGMIKLARKYSFDKYGTGRAKIVTLQNSFHGRTITTLNATGQDKFHNYFFPFTEGFDYAVAGDLDSVKAKADGETCAVMMELIQGEGGVLPLDREFVRAVEAFCRENDLLLLIDEVQTGIGRTGSLFCFQQYGIMPDVVSMAKGLGGGVPVGAVMAAKTCCDVLTPGTHATTFGGTPMVCAAANAVLDTVADPAFLAEVREKGEYLKNKIMALGSAHIQGVRGMGLMLGIIVEEGRHSEFANQLIEKGVLAITAGKNAVRLLPPLVISKEEMDEALAVMKEVF